MLLGTVNASFELSAENRMSVQGYYCSAFFLFVIGVFGMFNNFTVIAVMAKNKQLRSPLNLFLLNLACSDLGICSVGTPFSLLAAMHHGWYFGKTFCIVYAFLMSFFGITSITTLMALSFERYLMISRPLRNSELTTASARWILSAVWFYSFITTVPPLIGWGGFGLEGPGISCSIDWQTTTWINTTYIVFLFFLGLLVPILVMFFSYVNIVITMNKAGNNGLQVGVAKAEKRVAIMVLAMWLTFLLAWTPYSVVSLIMAFGDPNLITPEAAAMPAIIAKSSCIYNPIIYVGLNTQFRSAWSKLLYCIDDPESDLTNQPTQVTQSNAENNPPTILKIFSTSRNHGIKKLLIPIEENLESTKSRPPINSKRQLYKFNSVNMHHYTEFWTTNISNQEYATTEQL